MRKSDWFPGPIRRMMRSAVLGLLFLGAAGCGNKPVQVSGIVTLDGQPVKEAMVFFYPIGDGKEGRMAAGGTDASGKYELSTLGVADGAFRREYKVVIHKYVPNRPKKMPEMPPADTPEGIAARQDFNYWAYESKGIQPFKNSLPDKYGDEKTTTLTCNVTGSMTADFPLVSK